MTGDALHQRHVDRLQRDGARHAAARAVGVASVHQHECGREDRHHHEPGEQDGRARDEAQLLHPAEVGEAQHVEGGRRRDCAEQHPGPGTSGRDLERLPEVAAEEQLLLVAEEEVDAVVDADTDDDRDEHHREQRQVADDQRGHADRPAQAQREDRQHDERLAHPQEGDEQQSQREAEGQVGAPLAVVEGRGHLVIGQGRLAGDADVDVGELALEAGHRGAHALDRPPVAGEAAGLALRLGQDEQQPLVVGEEVAGARAVAADREQRPPRRLIGRRPVEAGGDLGDQVPHEAQIERALALLGQAEVEEAAQERVRDLGRHAVDELVGGRPRRERLHELLVVEDALADLGEALERQVEQRPPLELLGIDPVRHAGQGHPPLLQLPRQPAGVQGRLRQRGRLHHDRQVVELAELAVVLDVAQDVRLVLGEERARGSGEGERGERVEDREGRQQHAQQQGQPRPAAGEPYQTAQEAPDLRRRRQAYSSPAMNRSRRWWARSSGHCSGGDFMR